MSSSPGGLYSAISGRTEAEPAQDGRGVWGILQRRVDPAEFRPMLAPDIEVKRFDLRWGNSYTMIANPRDLLHYQLEPADAELLPLMDGTRTVKEMVVERFQESGDLELSGVADVVRTLQTGGFLASEYVDVGQMVDRALQPEPRGLARLERFMKTLTLEWHGANDLVRWFYRNGLRWFFLPWVAVPVLLVALGGGVAFLAVFAENRYSLSPGVGVGALIASFMLLLMNYFLTFAHELGHATVLVRNGRRIKSAGFMLYFGSPTFFVEASDGLMMDRRQRILQSFAGPYAEFVIAGAASLFIWVFPDSPASPVLYRFALLNYFIIFMNLIPLLELDGYWILSDVIQVPDLRPRSLRFIRYDLWRKLRGRERITRQEVGLALYGILGVAFTILSVYWAIFFWREVTAKLVTNLWEIGPAGRVMLVAIVLLVGGPIVRGFIALARALLRRLRAAWASVRFRMETGWRVEAAGLIDAMPLFGEIPEDVLSDLAGRVRLRSFPAGRPVFRQGDRPDAFYVVRRGVTQVIEEDPQTGKERVLRTLGRGESFGELGLVDGAPRSATVRASTECQLFEIDEGTFDRLLSDMIRVPEFEPTLQRVAELRALPAFAALEADALAVLFHHGSWVNVAPGEMLIEQGEVGDAFYAIQAGQVDVEIDGEHRSTLGPGAHFGEIALLMDVPRTATVVARTPARVFRLDREGFDRVVAKTFRRGTADPTATVDWTWQH